MPELVRDRLNLTRERKLSWKVCLHSLLGRGASGRKMVLVTSFLLHMGANNSSLTPLNCILKTQIRFDPQSLKKTHLIFLCDTAWPQYLLEDGKWWPVGRSLNYNRLDWFCRKQGKVEVEWVKVESVLPFSLRDMPDLCPKGVDLSIKPSVPSCPPTLPPYPGLHTEQT